MSFWGWLFHRKNREAELEEEVQAHLRMAAQERIEQGDVASDARTSAIREFGNVVLVKEVTREMWGLGWLETLLQDLRYGLRQLRRNPGFTAVAVLTLALGIGANTAIFSVINGLMLKVIPVSNPDQLVLLSFVDHSGTNYSLSYPAYRRFLELKQDFSGIVASTEGAFRLKMRASGHRQEEAGEVEQVGGEGVSGNYFSELGVQPSLGRLFADADDQLPEGQAVAVISYSFWQRRFGLDPSVVGRNLTLNAVPFTIVGIAPPGFEGTVVGERPDLWWPLHTMPRLIGWNPFDSLDTWWLVAIGRLQPGASGSHARAGLDVILRQVLNESLKGRGPSEMTAQDRQKYLDRRMRLERGATGYSWLRKEFTRPLVILMVAVGLVLLIACANVANLLLARATAREREMAVRVALGAGRPRLIRQLLTESLLMAVAGGALGTLVAFWGSSLILAFMQAGSQHTFLDVQPDFRVLGFIAVASVLTGILFGLAPAIRATRVGLTPALKGSTAVASSGLPRLTLGRMLVVSQVGFSLVLLAGAGLMVRTLEKLPRVDMGFVPENLVLFSLDSVNRYQPDQVRDLYQRIFERLRTLPGTRSVSYSQFSLMSGNVEMSAPEVEGYVPAPNEDVSCYRLEVGPRFFETTGIPVFLGRDFTDQDLLDVGRTMTIDEKSGEEVQPPKGKAVERPAVINEAMARYFFDNRSPIGRRFNFGGLPQLQFKIIGVVKDTKYRTLREGTLRAFYLLEPWGFKPLELRTYATASAVSGSLPRVIHEIDPNLLVTDIRNMQALVDDTLIRERFTAQLSGFFGIFALLLASIGLYGVMSYTVTRRTNEIGVRMALGAGQREVLKLVVREALAMVALGVFVGLGGAYASTRFLTSILYGIRPTDPTAFAFASVTLIGVALLASYLPARRATKVDPMVALRYE